MMGFLSSYIKKKFMLSLPSQPDRTLTYLWCQLTHICWEDMSVYQQWYTLVQTCLKIQHKQIIIIASWLQYWPNER